MTNANTTTLTHHVTPVRTYYAVYIALMVLLVATAAASFLPDGAPHFTIAMTIAVIKAVLIVLFFMHVYYSSRLTWIVATATILWMALLLGFLLADYFSRGWLDIPGK